MRTGGRFTLDALRRSVPVQLPSFRVSLKTFAPGQKVVWAASAPGRLCVIMAGEMTETGRARLIRYRPADLVYKPPEERPRLSFGDGVRTVTVELAPDRLADLDKAGLSLGRSFRHASATAAALGARISAELLHRDELTPLVVEGLALELLAEACRLAQPVRRPGGPRWLRQVRERLHSEFTRRLTLAECAREAGVHPVHLAQSFSAHYGESFGQCIRRLRIDLASRELAETPKSIADIALDSGFCDQSHLTRAFKRIRGLTPAGFRQAFRRA
jgi:AraC family transcriptional regulator